MTLRYGGFVSEQNIKIKQPTMKKLTLSSLSILILGIILTNISCEKLDIKNITKINTGEVSETSYYSATIQGTVIDVGENVQEIGHCWDTLNDPKININKQAMTDALGQGAGIHTEITHLRPGHKYYVRAYAITNEETVYGEETTFETTKLPNFVLNFAFPTDGALWPVGKSRKITWNTDIPGAFKLTLLKFEDGSDVDLREIATTAEGAKEYDYVLPSDVVIAGGYYAIRIESIDIPDRYKLKGFKATKPTISMVKPDANTKWNINREYSIEWQSTDIDRVDIKLLQDGNWVLDITDAHLNNKIQPWDIPQSLTTGTNYQIKINYHDFPEIADTSEFFEIMTEASISVTAPIAADDWQAGTTQNITWTDNISENVRIELFKNSTLATEIAGSTESDGSYSWTLPSVMTEGTDYTIKVTMIGNDNVVGESEQFTISSATVAPTITTDEITNIQDDTAISGGNITDMGSSNITARGVCWSTYQNPTIDDSKTGNGTGTGTFTSTLTNLVANTTYFVRAYATNSETTAYGEEKSFNYQLSVATVTTGNITNITSNSATCDASVTNDGNSYVAIRGVCWSINPNPTHGDSHATDGGNGTGTYTIDLIDLIEDTIYYVRAYATNNVGTSYGEEKTFKTNSTTITDYDNNTYNTVKIGNQWWMAENLKVTRYPNGDTIPYITDNTEWSNLGDNNTDDAYCYYNNNANNEADTYGALYTWAAAMNGASSSTTNPSGIQGACPTGWHLPSDDEWTELENYISNDSHSGTEGTALKATSGWYNSGNGTDDYIFSALPGGYRNPYDGQFFDVEHRGRWWSATESSSSNVYYRDILYNYTDVSRSDYDKSRGFSVRCVKN